MVDVHGNQTKPGTVQCFNGHDNLYTAVEVVRLAEKLGLTIAQRDGGTYWIDFLKNGQALTSVSFYQPSHAHAFLLGVAACSS